MNSRGLRPKKAFQGAKFCWGKIRSRPLKNCRRALVAHRLNYLHATLMGGSMNEVSLFCRIDVAFAVLLDVLVPSPSISLVGSVVDRRRLPVKTGHIWPSRVQMTIFARVSVDAREGSRGVVEDAHLLRLRLEAGRNRRGGCALASLVAQWRRYGWRRGRELVSPRPPCVRRPVLEPGGVPRRRGFPHLGHFGLGEGFHDQLDEELV